MAERTLLRCLILSEENADVLLVSLLLEITQEGKDSLVAARLRMKKQLSLRGGELIPRLVHRDALATRELRQRPPFVVVPRLGPRVYRSVAQRAGRVGDHQRLVVLENRPESVALRACAARIVEREKLRRGGRRKRAVVRALEPLREAQLAHRQSVDGRHDRIREQDYAVSLALGKRGSDGVAQASGAFRRDRQPVNYYEELLRAREVALGFGELVEVHYGSVDGDAQKSLRAEVLDHHVVRDFAGKSQGKRDIEAVATRQGENRVGYRLHCVRLYLPSTFRAECVSHARP